MFMADGDEDDEIGKRMEEASGIGCLWLGIGWVS